MSMTSTQAELLLKHVLHNLAWPNFGDASGLQPSASAGSVYVSLHSADPGDTDDQTSNELSYTGYGRFQVSRAAGEWTISADNAANTNKVGGDGTSWKCTAGTGTATHFGIGYAASGVGELYFRGKITTPTAGLAISAGIDPEFAAGLLDFNVGVAAPT